MRHKCYNAYSGKCEYAVIFARVSSERQEKGASIDAQLESIYEYCQKKELKVLKEFTITESSSRGDRKQYKEMLDFIKTCHHKVAIVVNCVDRLQRSYKDTPILDEMRKDGLIEVHFLKENLILHRNSNGSDILFWNLHVLMANSYILALSDNVKRSLHYNRSQGKWQNRAPIGYLNIRREDGKADIIIDPERAPIVKRAFEMYATGYESIDSILEMTRQAGMLTTKKILGARPITRNTIRLLLSNSFYYGFMENPDPNDPTNYILSPHIYPPLISKSLFDKVQDVLADRVRKRPHPSRNGDIPFAFRGLIRCGECGCAITTERHKKKSGRQYHILRCAHKQIVKCIQPLVNENIILDQLNREVFSQIKLNNRLWPALKEEVRKYLDEESSLATHSKKNAENHLKDLKMQANRLLDLYVANKITDPVYQAKSSEIEAEKVEAEKQLEKCIILDTDTKDALEKAVDLMGNISDMIIKANPQQKNELLRLFLEDCVLKGTRITYKIKKPFDILLSNPKDMSWLNIQTNDLLQLQMFAKEIKALSV